MKKALLILLTLTMVMSMMVIVPFGTSAEEKEKKAFGTVPADYKPEGTAVSTAEEFAAMDPEGKYYLANDITLSKTYDKDFKGTFDGNGKKVTTSVPLFCDFNGTGMNLTIAGEIVDNDSSMSKNNWMGAFANAVSTTGDVVIQNVCNRAPITAAEGGMGGIVGTANWLSAHKVDISNCANYAPITGGTKDSGGIIALYSTYGENHSEVINFHISGCENYGVINAGGRPGGIIGVAYTSLQMTDCYNAGDIQATSNYCGGVIGRLCDGATREDVFIIENCVNDGRVASYQNEGGGILGYSGHVKSLTFKNCKNNGDVVGKRASEKVNYRLGGIFGNCGTNSGEVIFDGCINTGNIGDNLLPGKSERVSGGIGGAIRTRKCVKYIDCYNSGEIKAYHEAAGIAAYPKTYEGDETAIYIKNCVNDGKIISNDYAGGMAGYARTDAKNAHIVFDSCINNGEIISGKNAAGISAYSKVNSGPVGYTTLYNRCGNNGNVTSKNGDAAGITAYEYAGRNGPKVNYCFTTGNIKGNDYVAGLVAYMNCWSGAEFKYNIVAGTLTGGGFVTLENEQSGVAVTEGHYAFKGSDGKMHYFMVPTTGKVDLTGNTVTYTGDKAIRNDETVNELPSDGQINVDNGYIYTFDFEGKKYAVYIAYDSSVKVTGTGAPIVTLTTTGGDDYDVQPLEWNVAGNKTATLETYDHPTDAQALFFSRASNVRFDDIDKNFISETVEKVDYLKGFAYSWAGIGGGYDGIMAGTRIPVADFASGKVAYDINKMSGKDVFHQNLDPTIFVVDQYPTTDVSHAKVVLSGGNYMNALFDMNDKGATPPTGDATVYIVIALAVSAIALTTVVLVRKKKVNN